MITQHTKESLIAFEDGVRQEWERGELPSLLHLCGGNEDQLLAIFRRIRPQDWVFLSHRGHYHALLKGMPEERLLEFIRSDRSMFIFDKELRIFQSAILGGCCGIAVGVAMAIQESGEDAKCYVFIGDGAADNGRIYEAALYATGHDLPIEFIIEDNRRQVDTDVITRRGLCHSFMKLESPKIIQYFYKPTWPHAGSGCSHKITFNRTYPLK